VAQLTLANIRQYVYDNLQIDTSDLPTAVLDIIISQSWHRVINSERYWSFYEWNGEFDSVVGQDRYSLNGLTNDEYTWDTITGIVGDRWTLRPVPHRLAQSQFPPPRTTGTVTHFSVRGGFLYLWPEPNSVITYSIYGYRAPTDWIALGGAPDAPDEFGPLVALGALSLAYTQQDDPAGAEQVMTRYEVLIRNVRVKYVDDDTPGPLILNGGTTRSWLPPRLRYDWE
jgi:hypothetical protein